MRELTFAGIDGREVRLAADAVEATSMSARGVVLHLVTGAREVIREPYLRVLEKLAGLV